jgi:hypothetical protein
VSECDRESSTMSRPCPTGGVVEPWKKKLEGDYDWLCPVKDDGGGGGTRKLQFVPRERDEKLNYDKLRAIRKCVELALGLI